MINVLVLYLSAVQFDGNQSMNLRKPGGVMSATYIYRCRPVLQTMVAFMKEGCTSYSSNVSSFKLL